MTGGVCFRTPDRVLAEWEKDLGLEEMTVANMEQYFRDVEDTVHVEDVPVDMRSPGVQLFAQATCHSESERSGGEESRFFGRCALSE